MSSGTRFTSCAHCRNLFPVVEGRVQQWRVSENQFACNEFCAEGVEEQARNQSRP
jgi:hypothetical protein